MSDMFLYLGMCLIGYFIGGFLKNRKSKLSWTSRFQTMMLIVILFTMGVRLGSNKEVISSLGTIGIEAFIITILTLIFSLAAVFITRKFMEIDNKGVKTDD